MTTYVFLHDGFADWELSFILPEIIQDKRTITTFGLTSKPVKSMGSLTVTPDIAIDQVKLEEAEALLIPGGTFWGDFQDERLDRLVKEMHASKRPLGMICDATGYAARLGILDEMKHAQNSLELYQLRAPNYRGQALMQKDIAFRDGHFVTADGCGAVEFTVKCMEAMKLYSPEMHQQWYQAFTQGSRA